VIVVLFVVVIFFVSVVSFSSYRRMIGGPADDNSTNYSNCQGQEATTRLVQYCGRVLIRFFIVLVRNLTLANDDDDNNKNPVLNAT
jgi:hypothetical protein